MSYLRSFLWTVLVAGVIGAAFASVGVWGVPAFAFWGFFIAWAIVHMMREM